MAGPLAVEDILAKQKSDRDAASKVRPSPCLPVLTLTLCQPKFLSKSERAALALEKRNAEVKVVQAREEEDKKERMEFERAADEERRKSEAARYGAGNDGRCDLARSFGVLLVR